MAIVKGSFESSFVTVYNKTARDTRLSLQARGLLLYLLSLPGDWKVSRKQLAKDNDLNEKTLQKYINELKEHGYATYHKSKNNGRFTGGDYCIYPTPQKELQPSKINTSTVDPNFGSPEKPPAENLGLHTKKESYKENNSSKPADAGFDFDLILVWIINQMSNIQQLTEADKIFIEGSLYDYRDSAESPRRAQAFSWVEIALQNRLRTLQRTAKTSAARDELNQSQKNRIRAQTDIVDQHTRTMEMQNGDHRNDTSWAVGLDD